MAPATRATARNTAKSVEQDESDYGSDVDDAALSELLEQAESQPLNPLNPPVLESIEEHNPLPRAAIVPNTNAPLPEQRRVRIFVDDQGVPFEVLGHDGPIREPSVEVEYNESNRVAFASRHAPRQRSVSVPVEDESKDARSPLERFRTAPKKPLSVTDIVSPAWCEIQYWYSLTKYGKVKKTPAMRQGSSVHKVLEEQVHTTVPVDVVSKEDRFGLRIWNIVQGLRTLRTTGMTREMEVWGVVEGQVINGVIDELSYTCPDQELEDRIEKKIQEDKKKEKKPVDQKTMDSFFANKSTRSTDDTFHQAIRKVYLTDVKTRGSGTVPNSEASLRPTSMQLMMYHRLLGLLASNSVPAERVFARYGLDSKASFSDTFISQIGGLDFNFLDASDFEDIAPFESSQDSIDELLAHNTLETLWTLMIEEFERTMPHADSHNSGPKEPLGNVLRAEFRKTGTGAILGSKMFAYDAAKLDSYLKSEMAWWSGERKARGVDIEEAFKCRICEFASSCTWRKEKVEEGVTKAKLRKEERRRSEI